MDCPTCGHMMVRKDFGGVKVDVCQDGCQSMWFDQGELPRVAAAYLGVRETPEAGAESAGTSGQRQSRLLCPRCRIPLQTHKHPRAKDVDVDECYGCGGFFLDAGEFTEIRDHYMSDAKVSAYAQNLMASSPEYEQARKEAEVERKRLETIAKIVRAVAPWKP